MSTKVQSKPSLPKVLVSILTTYERHGWPTHYIAEWLDYLRMRGGDLPYAVKIVFAHNFMPAAAARNHMAKVFIENTDADWLMMIDNDMAPPPNLLDCIKNAPPEADVVVPRFWLWDANIPAPVMCWGVLSQDPNQSEISELFVSRGFVELRKCGTGCIFFRRSAFEKTEMPYFWYPYTHEGVQAATEDIMFCEKLRAAGGRIFGNGDFEVGHYHNIDISKVAQAVYYKERLDTGFKIVAETNECPSEVSETATSPV